MVALFPLVQARKGFALERSEFTANADLGYFSITSYSGFWLILQLSLLSVLPVSGPI